MNGSLHVLRLEVQSDIQAFSERAAALARIARIFGTEPSGANWHRSLLESMAMEVPGIRPAIVSVPSLPALRDLLAFRHFFRHAYSVPLDAARLAHLAQRARSVVAALQQDFGVVDRWLAALAKAT